MSKQKIDSVDDYIMAFPDEIRQVLTMMRHLIRDAAPAAREKISWQMPAFEQNGNLVFYAAYKNHLGFYPGAEALAAFRQNLTSFKSSKGAVQFPYGRPLPKELIREIVCFKASLNKRRAEEKKQASQR
jgi:uncharacterized protein YdhG (YjbR/CyaY superfamily)